MNQNINNNHKSVHADGDTFELLPDERKPNDSTPCSTAASFVVTAKSNNNGNSNKNDQPPVETLGEGMSFRRYLEEKSLEVGLTEEMAGAMLKCVESGYEGFKKEYELAYHNPKNNCQKAAWDTFVKTPKYKLLVGVPSGLVEMQSGRPVIRNIDFEPLLRHIGINKPIGTGTMKKLSPLLNKSFFIPNSGDLLDLILVSRFNDHQKNHNWENLKFKAITISAFNKEIFPEIMKRIESFCPRGEPKISGAEPKEVGDVGSDDAEGNQVLSQVAPDASVATVKDQFRAYLSNKSLEVGLTEEMAEAMPRCVESGYEGFKKEYEQAYHNPKNNCQKAAWDTFVKNSKYELLIGVPSGLVEKKSGKPVIRNVDIEPLLRHIGVNKPIVKKGVNKLSVLPNKYFCIPNSTKLLKLVFPSEFAEYRKHHHWENLKFKAFSESAFDEVRFPEITERVMSFCPRKKPEKIGDVGRDNGDEAEGNQEISQVDNVERDNRDEEGIKSYRRWTIQQLTQLLQRDRTRQFPAFGELTPQPLFPRQLPLVHLSTSTCILTTAIGGGGMTKVQLIPSTTME